MKIAYLGACYAQYFERIYNSDIGLENQTFEYQYSILVDDYYGSFFMYHKWSIIKGINSMLIICNCKQLQTKWAKENNFNYSDANWEQEIVTEQLKRFKPDVFFMGSLFNYYSGFITYIRPFCENIFSWVSCPIPSGTDLSQVDLILTSVEHYAIEFKKMGIQSEVLTAAFESSIIDRMKMPDNKDILFSFIGGFSNFHSDRISIVRKLIKKTEIEVWGYGLDKLLYKSKLDSLFKRNINKKIIRQSKAQLWGLEMYELFYRSKISFNAHINVANGVSGNMRLYEATGMGSMLLTDGRPDSNDFIDGVDVVYYTCVEDAIEKAKYYLEHELERQKIATSGQKKTINNFSYENVTEKLINIFQKYAKK